jgi:hypothetical protein
VRGSLQLVHRACNRARGDGNSSKSAPSVPEADSNHASTSLDS